MRSRNIVQLLLGVALLAGTAAAQAAPTARFIASPVQGNPCVAPCAVHFDAIGNGSSQTTDPAYTRPFHTLLFAWDFGDPGSGRWAVSGQLKNGALGAIAGHLYERPGTYSARLTVTNPAGQTASAEQTIVVADPNQTFPAAQTWCFANAGTPGGAGFEDCPTRLASRHVVIPAGAAGGFDQALGNGYCNTRTAKSRCLFRTGDTFRASARPSLSSAAGPGLLAMFGAGPRPRIVGGDGFLGLGNGWTVAHFDVELAGTTSLFNLAMERSQSTVWNVRGANLRGACFESATGDAGFHSDLVGVFELECRTQNSASFAGFFFRTERTLAMGNIVDNGYGGEFNVRTVHFPRSVLQHNRLMRPQEDSGNQRNSVQIRAWAGNPHSGEPRSPAPTPTQYVIVSDNVVSQDNGAGTIFRTCQTNNCNGSSSAQDVRDLLFERNFFFFSRSGSSVRSGMPRAFWLSGGDMTVRDNVLDLQGIATSANETDRLLLHDSNIAGGASTLLDDRVHALNNTVYYDEASARGFTICDSMAGGGHVCRNNLVYVPGHGGSKAVTRGADWSASNNLFPAGRPFAAPVPGQEATVPEDFRLAPSAPSVDGGYGFASAEQVWTDFSANCRPADGDGDGSADFDVGAFEYGTDASCLAVPEPAGAGTGLAALGALVALRRALRRPIA